MNAGARESLVPARLDCRWVLFRSETYERSVKAYLTPPSATPAAGSRHSRFSPTAAVRTPAVPFTPAVYVSFPLMSLITLPPNPPTATRRTSQVGSNTQDHGEVISLLTSIAKNMFLTFGGERKSHRSLLKVELVTLSILQVENGPAGVEITYFNLHLPSRDQTTISWLKLRRCGVVGSAFFVAWHCVCNNWVVRRLIGMTSSEAVSGAYHGRLQKTHRLQALPNMPRSRDRESGYTRQFFRHACYSDAERS